MTAGRGGKRLSTAINPREEISGASLRKMADGLCDSGRRSLSLSLAHSAIPSHLSYNNDERWKSSAGFEFCWSPFVVLSTGLLDVSHLRLRL